MPTNQLRDFLNDHLILGSVEVPEQRQGEEVGPPDPPAAGETYDLAINRNHDGTLFHWMLRKPGHTGEPIAEGDFPAGTIHPGRDQLVAMIGAETNLVLQRLGGDERQGFWEWITVRVQSNDDVRHVAAPEAGDPEVEDASTSDRWHNRRKYLDRPAAIQGEIVDPIEHDNDVEKRL